MAGGRERERESRRGVSLSLSYRFADAAAAAAILSAHALYGLVRDSSSVIVLFVLALLLVFTKQLLSASEPDEPNDYSH